VPPRPNRGGRRLKSPTPSPVDVFASDDSYSRYLLGTMRLSRARLKMLAELDVIGLALKSGWISPDVAAEHLIDLGLTNWCVLPASAEIVKVAHA
jgi:hypothetical protein